MPVNPGWVRWTTVSLMPVALLAGGLCGCASRPIARSTDITPVERGYIDLKPGWRLRVVTPILKSGGYRLSSPERPNEPVGTLAAGPDFIGYEVSLYGVQKRNSAIRIKFRSAYVIKEGKSRPESRPLLAIFDSIPEVCCIRLIYLVRASDADHNLAVIGANDPKTLSTTTDRVQSDPGRGCKAEGTSFCVWLPLGIAVQPQIQQRIDGVKQWVPVV
jgi:hypothetical protein